MHSACYPIRIVCINVNVVRLHNICFYLSLYIFTLLRHFLNYFLGGT